MVDGFFATQDQIKRLIFRVGRDELGRLHCIRWLGIHPDGIVRTDRKRFADHRVTNSTSDSHCRYRTAVGLFEFNATYQSIPFIVWIYDVLHPARIKCLAFVYKGNATCRIRSLTNAN